MKFLELILLLSAVISDVIAQFPLECRCPHSCICNIRDKKIDCINQNLKYIPTELNTCSWPGITKVWVAILLCHTIQFSFNPRGTLTYTHTLTYRIHTHGNDSHKWVFFVVFCYEMISIGSQLSTMCVVWCMCAPPIIFSFSFYCRDLSGNKIRLVHGFAFSRLGNITHL